MGLSRSFVVSFLAFGTGTQGIGHGRLGMRQDNSPLANALYKNPSASVEARVADLVPRMTLSEKIGQLMQGKRFDDVPSLRSA